MSLGHVGVPLLLLLALRAFNNSNDWYAAVGLRQFFVALASLTIAVCAPAVPFWILGKMLREWSSRHTFGRS